MDKTITLLFHNNGLRSFIEVDLCSDCPRQDGKGCCGHYSPVFYPCDFAYFLENQPELLEYILNLPHLTILDYSLTVNNSPEGDSYRCQFHSPEGCILEQESRESICRHFVCSGIGWEKEDTLQNWKGFFDQLTEYENYLNNTLGHVLLQEGLSLRNKAGRQHFFQRLHTIFISQTRIQPDFFASVPKRARFSINRSLQFKADWSL